MFETPSRKWRKIVQLMIYKQLEQMLQSKSEANTMVKIFI